MRKPVLTLAVSIACLSLSAFATDTVSVDSLLAMEVETSSPPAKVIVQPAHTAPTANVAAATEVASSEVNTAVPSAVEIPAKPLSLSEKKDLSSQFKKSLSEREKTFDRDQKSSLKNFQVSQTSEAKIWKEQEKQARHKFFEDHLNGPQRKDYIKSYIDRKVQFEQKQRDDMTAFKTTLHEKRNLYITDLKNRNAQFKAEVDANVRPNQDLWK